jgi:hypothetical protein
MFIALVTKLQNVVVNTSASYSGGPDSNFGPETGYPDWGFLGFPQFLQENDEIVD